MVFGVSASAFLLSYFASFKGSYVLSGIILILTGFFLYFINYRKSGSLLDPAALFSLSWISAAGISCLKLSYLQPDWNIRTWLVIWLTYICFYTSYSLIKRFSITVPGSDFIPDEKQIRFSIIILTLISYACFTAEAVILQYIPLFTDDTPHAYSYFHISGVHYFTVLCVLVPALSVIWLSKRKNHKADRDTVYVFASVFLALLLPVLMVSRYQLVFSCMLAFITFVIINAGDLKKYLRAKYVIPFCISLFSLLALYVFITVERAHSTEYLNGIFEMKDAGTPVYFSQPYIYVANNFDNLNCLIEQLSGHTYGMRQLFPLFALSGLKFLKPEFVNFPIYVTKEELTTVTMVYDAFYDFGIPGVCVFSGILGSLMGVADKIIRKSDNPIYILVAAQLTGYLCLSFFTTWYSNPTTWFYIFICIAMNIIMWYT